MDREREAGSSSYTLRSKKQCLFQYDIWQLHVICICLLIIKTYFIIIQSFLMTWPSDFFSFSSFAVLLYFRYQEERHTHLPYIHA